jgi:prepilin-type N-terminal cleavage/methylation domain-containing protein
MRRGFAFVELLIALSIVGVALMVMLQQLTISYRENGENEQRSFAYEKGSAIIAELQAGVERGDIPDSEALEEMSDRGQHNMVLTTLTDEAGDPLPADHPMSGNWRRGSSWQWSRVLEVVKPPEQENMRYVRVHMYLRDRSGAWRAQGRTACLLNLPPRVYSPVVVYDVYVLAIAETPSLWQPLASLRSMLDSAVDDLETIDNGLEFRLHWITRLGYGRDPQYVPYVNTAQPADVDGPWVYWYPGLLAASAPATNLYVPELFSGRVRTDAGIVNDYDAASRPVPHAVCDQWNHCLRLPLARDLFAQRLAAGLEKADEPPLQILLADMTEDPERFRNALFVNLHGEGLPLPPMRNYSDAAKSPLTRPGVRAATHPLRLWTPRDPDGNGDHADSLDVSFLVHAFKTDPDSGAALFEEPITVQILGHDLTASINGASPTLVIRRLVGGVNTATGQASGAGRDYEAFDAAAGLPPTTPADPYEMYYQAGYSATPTPHTWIKLYNTPLVAPLVGTRGLAISERLYGMEYIPSPVNSPTPVSLAAVGGSGRPKNTARWLIQVPKNLLVLGAGGGGLSNQDRMLTVTTRLGADVTTGAMWPTPNQPSNLSTTFAWWTAAKTAVPPLERFQLEGDPRHSPYVDLAAGGASFPNGYNWQFDNLRDGAVDVSGSWPCFDAARLQDGFCNGVVADVPRYAQLLREALQSCGAVFTNPGGAVAGAILQGGEIALPPASPLAPLATVACDGVCFNDMGPVDVDTVTPNLPFAPPGRRGRDLVLGFGVNPFWARPWLGELAPDSAWTEWSGSGNLQAGAAPGRFHRELRSVAPLTDLPSGTSFAQASGSALGAAGGTTLVNAGTALATFVHQAATPSTKGALQPAAEELATAIGMPFPPVFTAAQPWGSSLVFPGTLPHFAYTDSYPRSFARVLETHYSSLARSLYSSGILGLEAPVTTQTAFLDIMGLTPATAAEHQALAAASALLGLQGKFRAGESSVTGRIVQVPRTEFLLPEEGTVLADPASMTLRWSVAFTRFDGKPYTPAYPGAFTEAEADLLYSILYSPDDGESWFFAANNQPADPEVRPGDASLFLLDAGIGNETFVLATPAAKYAAGDYLFRVVTYHRTRVPHSSWHQRRVRLTR